MWQSIFGNQSVLVDAFGSEQLSQLYFTLLSLICGLLLAVTLVQAIKQLPVKRRLLQCPIRLANHPRFYAAERSAGLTSRGSNGGQRVSILEGNHFIFAHQREALKRRVRGNIALLAWKALVQFNVPRATVVVCFLSASGSQSACWREGGSRGKGCKHCGLLQNQMLLHISVMSEKVGGAISETSSRAWGGEAPSEAST